MNQKTSMKTYNTLFFGTPDFAVPVLDTLIKLPYINLKAVITQPDKPIGKKQIITQPPIKTFALKNNLIVLQPTTIKSSKFIKSIIKLKPDVVIIIAYGKIITKNLLEIPKHGWLNIHGSLLPKYRGASPIQAVILSGEEKTGVTLMKIDEGLDTGPLIANENITINHTDNFEILHDKLAKLGAIIIEKNLKKYLENKIFAIPQEKTTTEITKTISKEAGKINWENPADLIEKQIRAYTPWPGTYTFWNNKRLKIIDGEIIVLPNNIQSGSVFPHENKIYVGTGNNAIKLNTLQLAGKKPTDIQSFIKGYPDFVNAKLN
ncbi:MAG: methionyl-tRNA formyltransferase [Candidatus Kerfeldbacteria bacterium]